jgi:hypothetical protein
MVREMQDCALYPRCPSQFGQNTRRHRPAAERAPVGAARWDSLVQLQLIRLGLAPPGQPHRGEQQRLARIRKQPEHWLTASHGGGQAKIEQRSAARDMQRTAIWITEPQHPCRVGVQANRLAGWLQPEAPRLRVVHRGRHGRSSHQIGHCLPGQVRPGNTLSLAPRIPSHRIIAVSLFMGRPAVRRKRPGCVIAAGHLCFLLRCC